VCEMPECFGQYGSRPGCSGECREEFACKVTTLNRHIVEGRCADCHQFRDRIQACEGCRFRAVP
jgi:hypothetical protein